jgi:hypothetical protein
LYKGIYSGENLAAATFSLLTELQIKEKLLALTGDNAANNETLISYLYQALFIEYDNKVDKAFGNFKLLMRFCRQQYYICCLGHTLNLIVKSILSTLKAGTIKEANQILESQLPRTTTVKLQAWKVSSIQKLRLIVL